MDSVLKKYLNIGVSGNAVNGNIDNALLFCGADAYKINKIKNVKEIIDELTSQI